MDWQRLKVTTEGRTTFLELDHGKANEMGSAELDELEALAAQLERSEGTSLVTFSRKRSSKGTPIFVAGANVAERKGWEPARVLAHVARQREVLAALRRVPAFHVAVVEGVALGWGTEFLLVADYVIACDAATFGLPETGLGIVPGAGGTAELWARIGPAHTLRLGMTGERIGADEALRVGLVHERAANVEEGLVRARALAELAGRRSPTALAAFKRGVLDAIGLPPAERTALEHAAYRTCVDSGEAAIGRESFETVLQGGTPPWGPRRT